VQRFSVTPLTTSRLENSTDWYPWQIFASIQAGNVFTFVPDASKANGAAAAIFRLLDDVPEIDATSDEGIKLNPAEVKGHIRLEGVHFRYPSRPAVRVLRDLTINVPPGT
jgi:ATP-binding cassette subfamily B (MDR/TAP) protein 1